MHDTNWLHDVNYDNLTWNPTSLAMEAKASQIVSWDVVHSS